MNEPIAYEAHDTEPYWVLHLNGKGLRFSTGETLNNKQLEAVIDFLQGQIRMADGLRELEGWLTGSEPNRGGQP